MPRNVTRLNNNTEIHQHNDGCSLVPMDMCWCVAAHFSGHTMHRQLASRLCKTHSWLKGWVWTAVPETGRNLCLQEPDPGMPAICQDALCVFLQGLPPSPHEHTQASIRKCVLRQWERIPVARSGVPQLVEKPDCQGTERRPWSLGHCAGQVPTPDSLHCKLPWNPNTDSSRWQSPSLPSTVVTQLAARKCPILPLVKHVPGCFPPWALLTLWATER